MDYVGIIKSDPHTIIPIIAKVFNRENCIEVVGGIKEEPTFLIPKVESVEITADDILTSSEDESCENETKPNEEIKIEKNTSIETLKAEREDQKCIASHGNIDYDDKFYMESNLDEGETLVLNDPQAMQKDVAQSNQTTRKSNCFKKTDQMSTACKTNVTTNCAKVAKKVVKIRQPNRVKENEYKITEKGKFQCAHCEFSVMGQLQLQSRKYQISQHILNKHREDKQLFQCPHCPYKSPWPINSHIILKHTSDKDINWLKCDKCDKKCKTKSLLAKHSITHHQDMLALELLKQHKCTICEKVFKLSDGLRRHIKHVHEKEKIKYWCEYCDFTAYGNTLLRRHIEVLHTDSKNLKTHRCQKCNNYETKFIHRLKAHMRIVHSTPLICEICGCKTNTPTAMKLHQLTHQKKIDEKELKYRCNKCDYKTYRAYSFNVHKLNHLKPNQIKYFYCYHCDFKAKRKDNLKTHVLRHFKKEEVTLGCYLCEFSTKTRQLLANHLSVKHEKEKQTKIPNLC